MRPDFNLVGNRIYEVNNDICLYAKALWSQERHRTTKWNDSKYDDKEVCTDDNGELISANAHCGASFRPDYEDQIPYLPEGHS